jgi:hypothetical protein
MGRGMLTDKIKTFAKEAYGLELTTAGLRLMPYFQYRLLNHNNLGIEHVNQEDRVILAEWREAGYITGGCSKHSLGCTKQFWDIMSELIWLGYVDLEEETT